MLSTQFTGKEESLEDFRKLFIAVEVLYEPRVTKQEVTKSEEDTEEIAEAVLPVLFSKMAINTSDKKETKSESKSPIIFLDIDGVCWVDDDDVPHKKLRRLTSDTQLLQFFKGKMHFLQKHYDSRTIREFLKTTCLDPNHMGRILTLCETFSAKIVVSSNWRHGRTVEHLQKLLDFWGLGQYVIGKTEDGGVRAKNISNWLAGNGHLVDGYIVLDDQYVSSLRERFGDKFIHCEPKQGFVQETFELAHKELSKYLPKQKPNESKVNLEI